MDVRKSILSRLEIAMALLLVSGVLLLWQGSRFRMGSSIDSRANSSEGEQEEVEAIVLQRPENHPVPASGGEELIALYERVGAEAAISAARELQGPDGASARLFLLMHLAGIDPEYVAMHLGDAGLSEAHKGFIVSSIMESWKDGAKALAWAGSGLQGDLRKSAVGQALRILVRTDPQAALAYLDDMPESESRRQALADLFISWGGADPKAALDYLKGSLTPAERGSATAYVLGAWARNSPQEALAWIRGIQDEALSARLLHEVAMNWCAVSPQDASAWLTSLPDSPVKAGIMASLAEQERNTIHCDLIQAPDLSWKSKSVAEMETADLRNWGYQDPEGARKYLEHASDGAALNELAITVAAGIASKESPAAAFEWAMNLPPEPGAEALHLAVVAWAGTDPSAVAEKLGAVEAERRPALATALAENWTATNPAAAAAWVAGYPGDEQKSLVRTVLQKWAGSEPKEAYQWLSSLPPGESRDEGISYMIVRESSSDPKSLVPWIELISAPQLREQKKRELDRHLLRAATD